MYIMEFYDGALCFVASTVPPRPLSMPAVLSLSHKIAQADTHLALGLAKAALSSRGERALSRGRTPDWTRRPPDWTPAKSQGASLKR